jgi:hypothetical protein
MVVVTLSGKIERLLEQRETDRQLFKKKKVLEYDV